MTTTARLGQARASTARIRASAVTTAVARVGANLGRNAREARFRWATVLHEGRLDQNTVDELRIGVAVIVRSISRDVEERAGNLSLIGFERLAIVAPADLHEALLDFARQTLVASRVQWTNGMASQERAVD